MTASYTALTTATTTTATTTTAATGRVEGARAAVLDVLEGLDPIGLDQVLDAAALQTRVDRKYLVPAAEFRRLAPSLAGVYRALQIGDRRLFGYESVYFDTDDLALYRAHLQGRRRRYKVRTRTYLDTEDVMFEVKLKGRRGETVKQRMQYSPAKSRHLDEAAREFLDGHLLREYGIAAPALTPSVTTTYARCTLVDPVAGSRVTCDVNLHCRGTTGRATPDSHVLVETKSVGSRGTVDTLLQAHGVRPLSVSKYCVGVALLHPEVAANPWHRTLRRYFGYGVPEEPREHEAVQAN